MSPTTQLSVNCDNRSAQQMTSTLVIVEMEGKYCLASVSQPHFLRLDLCSASFAFAFRLYPLRLRPSFFS